MFLKYKHKMNRNGVAQKIGSLCAVLITAGWLVAAPSIQITPKQADGSALSRAYVGVPFLLDVVVTDIENPPTPTVPGLDPFELSGRSSSTSVRVINGKRSISTLYRYHVRCDKKGTYAIGPIAIDHDGTSVSSGTLQLPVGVGAPAQETKKAPVMFHLEAAKHHFVEGERVPVRMRFYYNNDAIAFQGIEQPTLQGLSMTQFVGPRSSQEEIEGQTYFVLEWQGSVFPITSGELIIPAIRAVYTAPIQRRSLGLFGAFHDVFGGGDQQKQIYSNAVTLHVDPLPEHDTPVDAVGCFTSFRLDLNEKSIREHEPFTVTLEVAGTDGNFERLPAPTLRVQDDVFSSYDSKSSITTRGNKAVKIFEYVVQARKVGDWQLPPQTFTFFDTELRAYRTLTSNAATITVTPGVQQVSAAQSFPGVIAQSEHTSARSLDINRDGAWFLRSERLMPWWLFFGVMIGSFLLVVLVGLFVLMQRYRRRHYRLFKKRGAFKAARAHLKNLQAYNSYAGLYELFNRLFADRWQLPNGTLSEEAMMERLRSGGFTEHELNEWRSFFTRIAGFAFSGAIIPEEKTDLLWYEARKWLTLFEKKL